MAQAAAFPDQGNSPFSQLPPIYKELAEAKANKGLTFDDLGKAIGKDEVWVAAAFYGQAKLSTDQISKLAQVLGLHNGHLQNNLGTHWYPNRGLGPPVPTDPVIYRLYEGVLVYGQPIKTIIHEKFGDGIMSMIDCNISIEKKANPKGDRVLLTFDGKFLPYATW